MRSIPPAIAGDAEDVVWGLETAEALWNRGERVDAIVWLRRAAQAAGVAEQDDRALELARQAAELAEWIANNPAASLSESPPTEPPIVADVAVDDLLVEPASAPPTPVAPVSLAPASAARVPTAAEAHAGMLNPWADAGPARKQPVAHAAPLPVAPNLAPVLPAPDPASEEFDSDEVVTSAPPFAARLAEPPPRPHPPSPPPRTPQPPRSPARPEPPRPPVRPPLRKPPAAAQVEPAAAETPTPTLAVAVETPTPVAAAPVADAPTPVVPLTEVAPAAVPPPGVNLSGVEAFADLPDDARAAFASAATIRALAREDEVSGFALALVLDGSLDLSATIVDAAAERLGAGAVMRARGTIEMIAPVRLVAASDYARIATWDEAAVTDAFRTCPWVEDNLRASGDRLQALVGITMGPLGERLDPSLRADVTRRLQLRALAEHEIVATQGKTIPGLLVVGGGELELLGDDGTPSGAVVRAGEFLFPNEALRAASAPSTVRASRGGALVLLAERGVAQELLVTCPPLLEIFAGM